MPCFRANLARLKPLCFSCARISLISAAVRRCRFEVGLSVTAIPRVSPRICPRERWGWEDAYSSLPEPVSGCMGKLGVVGKVFRSRLFGEAVTGVFQELHGGSGRGSVS